MGVSPADARALARTAAEIRLQVVRMMGHGQFHHFGGSLSSADLLVGLYFHALRYRAGDPEWPERDRFVLSKGHCVPALYACLARTGFLPPDELPTLKHFGSRLQGHPDLRRTPGLEANTGSLGMGLSVANGIALACRIRKLPSRVYVLMGDGECQEGQIWEAAMTAAHYRLADLTALVDRNRLQAMGPIEERLSVEPFPDKWRAFGWDAVEVEGHDLAEICDALDAARTADRPRAIIAHTVKGKGVSFMENDPSFHNAAITEAQFRAAEAELLAAVERSGR